MNQGLNRFSDRDWLAKDQFSALAEISHLLNDGGNKGREALIRALEHRDLFSVYDEIIDALTQLAGLYPYLAEDADLSAADLINLEYHTPYGLEGIVLHSAQAKVYRALMDGVNVILSAPTSFGKSLLIDAMVASKKFSNVVVIVPTIALIDETRRRLSKNFASRFKIITHLTQVPFERNIYVLTQERFVEFEGTIKADFFILDEFYKLSPNRKDERTFVLNQAFYQLFKSGAQFFLIGPNVQDITINETDLNFRFFRFDFTTVATEVRYGKKGAEIEEALKICREVTEPTLIFCKSSNSAYQLAKHLISNGVAAKTDGASQMAEWLRNTYSKDWVLADLIEFGFAVHHGSLPRSVAYHMLRKFNDGSIRFLMCTSTIIEGVNTAAKNIIIYDNKIATRKFDQFTFNNIKGRAGRMFRYFVGHVYVLHAEPEPELPIVDIPSLTQPENIPDSLLVQLDHRDLSDRSLEQIRYLHAQDALPLSIIRQNTGVDPRQQIDIASEISGNLALYHRLLGWSGFPTSAQLVTVCELIFRHFLFDRPKDDVVSGKQLSFFIFRLYNAASLNAFVADEIFRSKSSDPSEAIENAFSFLRKWCEFHGPKYISAVDRIQKSVFERHGLKAGDYELFVANLKHLFMHPAVTILEEYGLPYSITLQILESRDLGKDVDDIIESLTSTTANDFRLTPFEREILNDTLENLHKPHSSNWVQ